MLRFWSRQLSKRKDFYIGIALTNAMDDLGEEQRGIDDIIFPRKKTITDLWREKEDREMKG